MLYSIVFMPASTVTSSEPIYANKTDYSVTSIYVPDTSFYHPPSSIANFLSPNDICFLCS